MRLVHLSDLHLGYRQYQRLTEHGINQRESDVARAFRGAVDQIVALKPDVIVIAGDVFHSSRPSNAAILHAFRELARLRAALPDAAIAMVAGNHDTPRTTESGSILGLFEALNIRVAAHEARAFRFEQHDLSILGVPDVPGPMPSLALRPEERSKHNVLVLHGDVDDVVPRYFAELDRASVVLSRRDLRLADWSYVALGHYHVHRAVADNAYYSGSLDYTSLNVWFDKSEEEELGVRGKGIAVHDLATGRHEFIPLPAQREFIDLKPISGRDKTPAEVDEAIRKALEKVKGGIDDKVVRLVIKEIPRQVSRELNHKALREYKQRALSLIVDLRRPEFTRREAAGAPARRPSVADVVRDSLTTREIPSDLDRGRLVELGLKYLEDAESFQAFAAVPESAPETAAEAES